MASQSRLKAFKEASPGEEGGSSFKMTLNQIASIAQNSVRQSQEKTPPRYNNDSMDQMGREFMRQYNQAMQETRPSPVAASHAQLLDKELQVKELQAENLQLKGVIEEMKNDMEVIVLKIQEERLQGEYKRNNSQANEQLLAMQQELIAKERRIGDLERKLRQREEEIGRVKAERDRLVVISNDLRAELNQAQRRILEQAEDAEERQGAMAEELEARHQEAVASHLEEQRERLGKLEGQVDELADHLRELLSSEHAPPTTTAPPRRVGGGGRVSSRERSSSPSSLKKRGEAFLQRIESLKENLQLEGR